jgi:hypothetical protein
MANSVAVEMGNVFKNFKKMHWQTRCEAFKKQVRQIGVELVRLAATHRLLESLWDPSLFEKWRESLTNRREKKRIEKIVGNFAGKIVFGWNGPVNHDPRIHAKHFQSHKTFKRSRI